MSSSSNELSSVNSLCLLTELNPGIIDETISNGEVNKYAAWDGKCVTVDRDTVPVIQPIINIDIIALSNVLTSTRPNGFCGRL